MTAFAYHYHAMDVDENLGHRSHGVAICGDKVDSQNAYLNLQGDIAEYMGKKPNEIVITSLTFLHEVP